MTKLLKAVLAGKDGAALALIGAVGVDINAQDDQGHTALMLALVQGQNAVVKKLLDQGALTGLTDKFNHTALDMVRDGGNDEGRDMLYRRLDEAGVQSEMFHAARQGNLDALTFLVEEMNARLPGASSRGKTALEEAEVSSQFETAAWIEEKLANFPEDAGRDMHAGVKQRLRPMKQIVLKNA